MFIVTMVSLPIPLAIAFYIVWNALHNQAPEWAGIAAAIVALAGFYYQIWDGKRKNKDAETGQTAANASLIVAQLKQSGEIPAGN